MYRPARGGRSCEHFGGYKTINRIPFTTNNDTNDNSNNDNSDSNHNYNNHNHKNNNNTMTDKKQ